MEKGTIYFVGGGPGDAGLISVKGREAIEKADVIVYDRLLNPKLLEYSRPDCELLYCGKTPYIHALKQEEINELLITRAALGKCVVRLKGGDPAIFGRVGEEAECARNNDIPFEIIPGITSGIAAPMYAGVPVTHRDVSGSFAMVTAHGQAKDLIDWDALTKGVSTIAFYMGVANLPYICEGLAAAGMSIDTPVLVIQWGTYGRQKTASGTLADIVGKAEQASIQNPAVTLVGHTINMREKLQWFDQKPLSGQRFLVARTGTAKSTLAESLEEKGGEVVEFPRWVASRTPVRKEELTRYLSHDRILFTSPESVQGFLDSMIDHQMDVRDIRASLFTLSTKSKRALQQRGLTASLKADMDDTGTLLVVGDREEADRENEYRGHEYFQSIHKVVDRRFLEIGRRMIEVADIDTVLFSNGHSVDMLIRYGAEAGLDVARLLSSSTIATIGKTSAAKLESLGFPIDGMPAEPSVRAMVDWAVKQAGKTR